MWVSVKNKLHKIYLLFRYFGVNIHVYLWITVFVLDVQDFLSSMTELIVDFDYLGENLFLYYWTFYIMDLL